MQYILELGKERLVVDTNKLTIRKMRSLAEKVSEINKKRSPLTKYPMKNGETFEEWEKRINEEDQSSRLERKKGESYDDYTTRLTKIPYTASETTFEMLKAIAEITDQSAKVTEESFEDVSVVSAKDLIKNVLSLMLDE